MIDRNKVKKMWVWDKDKEAGVQRYVIDTNKNESCLTVSKEYEKSFEEGYDYTTYVYEHYKELPEEKWRFFKPEELTEDLFDCLFRSKSTGRIITCTGLECKNYTAPIEIHCIWQPLETLFDAFEMKKKGEAEWHPAGVKE